MKKLNKKGITGIELIVVICFILLVIGFIVIFTGCNMDVIDTVYSYDYAYIRLPNGEIIEGVVETWRDYEDGEQLQVTIDGVTYLTNSYNCTLVKYN